VTGDEVVISEGDVAHAVIASTAIPGLFPPVQHHGRCLVDGALAACTPISVAAICPMSQSSYDYSNGANLIARALRRAHGSTGEGLPAGISQINC
jgi:Patatin-like phospholipase